MTLTVNVDPLTLKGTDREFFYEVVDKLDEYAAKNPSTPLDEVEEDDDSEGSEE